MSAKGAGPRGARGAGTASTRGVGTGGARRGGRPGADRRLLDRRRQLLAERVRRRRRRLAWAVLATVVLVGGVRLVSSPLFALSSMRVEGTRALRTEQVLAAARVHPGEPYLTLDLGAIDRRVQALPRVARAEVRRAYPSSLRIVVVERTPVASVAAAGRYWLVSADGVVLDSVTARAPGVPFVADVPLPAELHAGSRLPAGGPLANALEALAGLRPELARLVSGVRAASIDGLEFQLRGGTSLRYGLAELQPAKDAAALLLLGQLRREGRRAARIDVRVPSAPTVLEGGNLHAGG